MAVNLHDPNVLRAVSPLALSAYARSMGWAKTDEYGENSDVYTGLQLPEIVVPRTQRLGDYAQVVARLIGVFAQVADIDEIESYNNLVVADRDVTRVRASNGDNDGTISLEQGADLVTGSRDMVFAAAASLREQKPVYTRSENREAREYLARLRLGQTERGSFVITILSPVISSYAQENLMLDSDTPDDPLQRRVTLRLAQALSAARNATSKAIGGDTAAFFEAVSEGTSANLCEALVRMMGPFNSLEVSTTWALTHPMVEPRHVARFFKNDARILRRAARSFRDRGPELAIRLRGTVQILRRDYSERSGTVTLRALIEGKVRSVTMVLSESDYNRAIQANADKFPISVEGNLSPSRQRWRLLNPRITEVNPSEGDESEAQGVQR